MFTRGQAIEFVEKAFGTATLTNGGLNASVVCPHCASKADNLNKRKLVIRTDDFLCHCWVCDYRAPNLVRLLRDFKPHLIEEYREKFGVAEKTNFKKVFVFNVADLVEGTQEAASQAHQVHLPTGFTLIATNRGKGIKSVEDAWKYLKGRGVTEPDLWYWKFGVTDHRPAVQGSLEPNYRFRVIVPSFDPEGNLNYFSARAYWDKLKGSKYTNPDVPRETVIFNEINLDWSKELTLVEGVFDLVKCNENATAVLGSVLGKDYKLFQKIATEHTPVLLAFDPDAKKKTYKTAKLLHDYGVSVRIFEVPKEFEDVGQMTKDQFIAAMPHAREFKISEYLRYCLESL